MGLITVLAAITLLSSCSARMITQNVISSVLQEIMSPANTGKAIQMIEMMARSNKNIASPNILRSIASNDCGLPAGAIITNGLPARVIGRNEMPVRIVNEMGSPRVYITNEELARINEPRVFNHEMAYSRIPQSVRPVVRDVVPTNLIELPREIYQAAPFALQQESIGYPCHSPAPRSSYLPVATPAPNPYLPFGGSNPYLPVASPISAMSPSLLPQPTQSKGQFLRKIPIPPPTL